MELVIVLYPAVEEVVTMEAVAVDQGAQVAEDQVSVTE